MSYKVLAQVALDLGDGITHKGYVLSGKSFNPHNDPDIGDVVEITKPQPSRYVIFGGIDDDDGQPMFWHNEDGWVVLSTATKFTIEESRAFKNIPCWHDGSLSVWVELPKE